MILTVAAGLTEFVCPTCQLPQMLPPELMPQQQRSSALAHGIDPTKIQLPCAHCKAILNVPHGLSHFACPQCGIDLAVDISKIRQFLPHPSHPAALRPPPPLPPMPQEEVNEVFTFPYRLLFILRKHALNLTPLYLLLLAKIFHLTNSHLLQLVNFQKA